MTIVFNGQVMTTNRGCAYRLLFIMEHIKKERL